MKQRIILIGASTLLLAVMAFMARDMFFSKPDPGPNPYDYNIRSVREADTTAIRYSEILHFSPGLSALHGISIDRSGRIFICGDSGVEVYDPSGKLMSRFAIPGTANCIHVTPDGRIFLGMEDHIEIFDIAGRRLMKWGSCGSNAVITSIAAGGGDVYIADAGARLAYCYDQSGKLQKKIGEKDPARRIQGFVVPSPYFDLAPDPDGALWIANPGRYRLERYDHDGNLTRSWGESSIEAAGFCGCCNPSHFAVFPDGSFVTSEKGIERIKVYSPQGVFRCMVAGPDSFIEGTRGLDLAVDPMNRIIVLDPEKKLVRIFTLNGS